MKGIRTHSQKDEKKSKENTASSVKKPKKVIPKYETTKQKDFESYQIQLIVHSYQYYPRFFLVYKHLAKVSHLVLFTFEVCVLRIR